MNQASSESEGIFDFIMAMRADCSGDWSKVSAIDGVSQDDVERFLEYAATVCSNMGNYLVSLYDYRESYSRCGMQINAVS